MHVLIGCLAGYFGLAYYDLLGLGQSCLGFLQFVCDAPAQLLGILSTFLAGCTEQILSARQNLAD